MDFFITLMTKDILKLHKMDITLTKDKTSPNTNKWAISMCLFNKVQTYSYIEK